MILNEVLAVWFLFGLANKFMRNLNRKCEDKSTAVECQLILDIFSEISNKVNKLLKISVPNFLLSMSILASHNFLISKFTFFDSYYCENF